MRGKWFFFTIVFGSALIALIFFSSHSFQKPYRQTEVIFSNVTVIADVAETQEQKIQGLAGRETLSDSEGMLFPYDEPRYHAFWMKGMRIPIDIFWLNDGYVVDMAENVPPPNELGEPPLYKPKEPALAVLEVRAGFARKYAITIGSPYTLAPL